MIVKYDYHRVYEALKALYYNGKLQRGIGLKSIKEHPAIPAMRTLRDHFGSLRDIKKSIKQDKSFDQAHNYQRCGDKGIPPICTDCIYDRETCGRNPKVCEKEARLYRELGDKNNVMEFVR